MKKKRADERKILEDSNALAIRKEEEEKKGRRSSRRGGKGPAFRRGKKLSKEGTEAFKGGNAVRPIGDNPVWLDWEP